jgi:hypothetical protein
MSSPDFFALAVDPAKLTQHLALLATPTSLPLVSDNSLLTSSFCLFLTPHVRSGYSGDVASFGAKVWLQHDFPDVQVF